MQCISDHNGPSLNSEIDFSPANTTDSNQANNIELNTGKNIKFLTQNTMLIPFNFVAPAFDERTGCIIDLILNDYDIVCLQEVFNGSSQNAMISSWLDMIDRGVSHKNFSKWQTDYFHYWYNSLPEPDKNIWHPLDEAQNIAVLAYSNNFWGVKVLDKKVNDIQTELICNPYYVIGPDMGCLNIRQDGGLMILSKYPIIECSAMTYSSSSGSDRLASKGVIYARIQIGPSREDYIHVFNTHIQSHDYIETRLVQIGELVDFISEIIKSDKDYIRPILAAGDFNVSSDKPENWMELADLTPPETEDTDIIEYPDKNTVEYRKFKEILKDVLNGKVYLTDSWQKLNPKEPGFTWIGKDWVTGSNNSYGDIGNQVATEKGGPQRIDYIFYFGGNGKLFLEPVSISLIPEKPVSLYCFDERPKKNSIQSRYGCEKISLDSDCSYKSYTVSDHLGLAIYFDIFNND